MYNTGNPVPSAALEDMADNAQTFDALVTKTDGTTTDRKGITRRVFQQILMDMGFQPLSGSFQTGETITARNQTLYDEVSHVFYAWGGTIPVGGYVVPAGSTPATAGGTGVTAWSDKTDLTLRSELSGVYGASLMHDGGATQEQLNECNLLKFSPVAYPADSTSAFTSAYAAADWVYVPEGVWFTTVFYPDRTYGIGRVFCTEAADWLYQDSGERPLLPYPRRDNQFVERVDTWGNYERAAGKSLVVNSPTDRAGVSGYVDDSQMATYINADHVGLYIGMWGPKKQITTADVTTTYSIDSITAPEITQANVDNGKLKIGMFVKTKHFPRYSGRILDINVDTNTLTIRAWYAEGNTSSGQVPANGTGAVINAADKIWGQNTNVFITSDSTAKTATGYELGLYTEGTVGVPVVGHHVVNLTNAKYLDIGYNLTGFWAIGINFDKDTQVGVRHSEPITSALRVENLTNSSWAGSALELSTNYPTSAGSLIKIFNGATLVFKMDSNGHRSSQRESAMVLANSATLTPTSQSIIMCVNTGAITLSSSGPFKPGHVFEIKAAGTASVTFTGGTLSAGQYGRFVWDGLSWIKLLSV